MRKLLRIIVLLVTALAIWQPLQPITTNAAAKTTTVAVILLGSMEFQQQDYYTILKETLRKKYPPTQFRLDIGEYPQQMFEHFSYKQGLYPGSVPPDQKLIDFAWTHSFDQVLFFSITAPSYKDKDADLQWDNAEVTLTTRAIQIQARRKKKLVDSTTMQSVKLFQRSEAKRAAFTKCIESLMEQLRL